MGEIVELMIDFAQGRETSISKIYDVIVTS